MDSSNTRLQQEQKQMNANEFMQEVFDSHKHDDLDLDLLIRDDEISVAYREMASSPLRCHGEDPRALDWRCLENASAQCVPLHISE